MTTRRSFIRTLAAIAPVVSARRGWAASADPARVAMVVGNSAYRSTSLPNPVNDARVSRQTWDTMGNSSKRGNTQFDVPQQFSPAELQVGRKWAAAFKGTEDGSANSVSFDLHIARTETVSMPAVKFEAFRVDGHGWNRTHGHRLELRMWRVPGLNFLVKYEHLVRTRARPLVKTERHELVSLRQHALDRGIGGMRSR